MNLAALQRVDSAVTEIIDSASQVALYKFTPATNGWEKTEIEGALFVFEWSKTPSYGLFVINRLSTTNLLEVITQDVEFQTQSPFLLYKTDLGINCIWFYDTEECERVGRLCQSLANTGRMSSRSKYRQRCASESDSLHKASLATPSAPQNGATKDIVALLSKAKDQYNMKKAEASSNGHKQHRNPARARGSRTFVSSTAAAMASVSRPEGMSNGHTIAPSPPSVLHKPTPLRTTNGVVPAVASTEVLPLTPLSVESLFAAAGHQKEPEVVRGEEDAKQALLRALLANPDNRVEHVERIQRSQDVRASEGACQQPRLRAASCQASMSSWVVADGLLQRLNLGPPSDAEDSPSVVTPAMLELGPSNGERHSPPTGVTINDQLPLAREPCKRNLFVPHIQAPAASDLPLLTPMAFTNWTGFASATPPVSSSSINPQPSSSSTLGPCMNGEAVPCSQGDPAGALTKDQLKDALIHMLQTDDSFLVKLHEAYVGSLKSRFNLEARNSSLSSTSRS
ncbi:hypothetical protein V5799_015635 [Amblyomma americanum]|uniref:mRNA-decapping enzyme C-terminal domain-containing protein n=1 Tax=Amblyomma americanum TaxID=6943 RepID=A0AAQ4F859_AMBAM